MRVEPDGLEQPVPAIAAAVGRRHERLLDESREHVGDLTLDEAILGADRFDCGEVERARKHCEPAKEDPLVRFEQVVTPLERRSERLLSGRRGSAA